MRFRWFARLIGSSLADAILADLEEQRRLRAKRSKIAAAFWFHYAILGVALYALGQHARESGRAIVTSSWGVSGLMADLRYAARARGFVAMTVVTLVLSVGANLVVFTLVAALWRRPPSVADPDHVAIVADGSSAGAGDTYAFTMRGLRALADLGVFSDIAGQVQTSGDKQPLLSREVLTQVGHPVETLGVTTNYFDVLGVHVMGRTFHPSDDRAGAPPVAIISYRLWKNTFGGRPDIAAGVTPATPVPLEIIGVAPDGFHGARLGEQADIWVPANVMPQMASLPVESSGDAIPLLPIVRIRAGVSAASAERVLNEWQHSRSTRAVPPHLNVIPLAEAFGSPSHRTIIVDESAVLILIAIASGLVLLGGCVTLASSVHVHCERRRQEFGVRLAHGASRSRLVWMLTRETAFMATIAAVIAMYSADLALMALPALSLPGGVDLDRLDLTLDWRVATCGLGLSLLTSIIAAAAPVVRFTRSEVAGDLLTARTNGAAPSMALRQTLLAAHAGLTVMVLVTAGLFVKAVTDGYTHGAGFDVARTVFVNLRFAPLRFQGDTPIGQAARAEAIRGAMRAAAGLPSVERVSIGFAPLGPDRARELLSPMTVAVESGEFELRIGWGGVSPEFFPALGVPILQGRNLTDSDVTPDGFGATVITRGLAAELWPGESPLGRRITVMKRVQTVVGVIPDFAYGATEAVRPPLMFNAANAAYFSGSSQVGLTIRASDPIAVAEQLRFALPAALHDPAIVDVTTGPDLAARVLGRERLGAWFFASFGGVSLLLGITSVFGLVGYLAESRRREFGIRMAMGATPRQIGSTVLEGALTPVLSGIAVGLAGATVLGFVGHSLLVGVQRFDAANDVVVTAVMIAASLGAAQIAILRMRRASPMDALRAN